MLWILGVVVVYLAIGAVYARSQAMMIHRWAQGFRETGPEIRKRVLGWPMWLVVDFARGPAHAWVTRPVTARQEKITRLRSDAAYWRQRLDTGSDSEREMAATLVRSLDEQATELGRKLGRSY